MKYNLTLLIVLLSLIDTACTDNLLTEQNKIPYITGNTINQFSPNHGTRTTVAEKETFPTNTDISFYGEGDLEASGILLTWNGNKWESNQPLTWKHQQAVAEIKAYHPAGITENQYFYDDSGELFDLLGASETCPSGSNIALEFQHLFAKVTFQLAQSLNRRVQKIIITPSVLISSFHPLTQQITYEKNDKNLYVTKERNPEGTYTLIVPPDQPLALSLKIITSDGECIHQLPEQTYKPGINHIQSVNSRQKGVGISSVEDYIAFTHLINGYDYENRSLDEFGETQDGRTTYYLLKDLTFTEEESGQVLEIGYKSVSDKQSFDHIFEGNYHTLSGLTLTAISDHECQGIFGYLGEEGIIRNLIIKDLTILIGPDSKAKKVAGLISFNKGIVDNCVIQGFTAESNSSEDEISLGGICNENNNLIINCKIESFTAYGKFTSYTGIAAAGLTYINSGTIANCQIRKFRNTAKKETPIICHRANEGIFFNILCAEVSGSTFTVTSRKKAQYIYYPSTVELNFSNNPSLQFIPYDEKTYLCTSGTSVESALNQQTTYNGYALIPWQTETDQTVTLNTYGY